MKTPSRLTLAALFAASSVHLAAQTAAPAPNPATAPEEDTIVLSPFEVRAERDTGYQAAETLAGTRIRTELRDVASAIQVITRDFMNDIGATDTTTLLQYTTNAEVAGTRGTFSGLGNGTSVDETANLRSPAAAQRVRGLDSADITRDFFVSDIPWDSFNVSRIDIQRGPNSLLFGLGSPAGIVNAATRTAEFRPIRSVEARVGSYGSFRSSVDLNEVIIPNVLAVRFDALWHDEKFQQEPAYQNDRRYYGAVRFEPQLFKRPDFRTSLRVNFEDGEIEANRPRLIPPNDSITPWFRPVSEGGMGKLAIVNGYTVQAQPTTVSPWLTADALANQQQPIWFINGDTGQLNRIYAGFINRGARNNDGTLRGSGQNLLGQRYASQIFGLTSYNLYANNAGLPNAQYGQYRTMSLTDPTVFDFYNNLLDGPNKKETEKWDAYNITLTQTGWNDRLGFELNYDRQRYKRSAQALITNPTINIDILQNFQDLTPNPNFGRAYVIGGPGGGQSHASDREYVRGQIFGEVRSKDIFDSPFLQKLLGKHRFTGVASEETYSTETRSWQMYATNQSWAAFQSRTDGGSISVNDRPPVGVMYLGSSLASRASASGAGIPGVNAYVGFPNGSPYYFDSTWNAPAGVNFSDPWTVPANLLTMFSPTGGANWVTGAPDYSGYTQASNPANYVGWNNTGTQLNLMRSDMGDNLDLLTGATKEKRTTKSKVATWQGFLWNEAIVATFGWRSDEVTSRYVTARPVTDNRGILNLLPSGANPYALPNSPSLVRSHRDYVTYEDESMSGGVVIHINRLWGAERDPLPLNVSLTYSESNNFRVVNGRSDIYGNSVQNPTGETKDYSLLLSTKDGKYSMRLVKYESAVQNASTSANLSQLLGNPIQQGLRFRNVFLYKLHNYPWSSRETPQDRNDWQTVYLDTQGRPVAQGNVANPDPTWTLQTQAQADAMRDASIRAWNDIQRWLAQRGYFQYWGYNPVGPDSALVDRSTYEANPAAYMPDPATVYTYAYPQPSGPTGLTLTSDTQSKGYELELTANPTRNWRLTLNAAKTTAVRTNVGGVLIDEFINYMDQQMAGPAGDMRQFSGGWVPGNLVRQNWANTRSQYTLLKLQEAASVPELRKWRFNFVTNYSFREGLLKGVGIGGSYRWQDKVVIGYPVIPGANGQADFDLSQPYYGPAEDAIDLWTSYERKLTKKIHWKIQLNVKNAFADEGIIPISVQPDGRTWASVRIKPVQEWYVTNTFTF